MTLHTIAPYGRWTSAISAKAATAGTKTLTSPRASPGNNRGYFLVSEDDGRSTIYQHDAAIAAGGEEAVRKVLPAPRGVGTTVYEYGGQAYAVLGTRERSEDKKESERSESTDQIVFADSRDNGVYVLDVATGAVATLVKGTPELKYGDFDAPTDGGDWILAIQEDHTHPAPADVRNYVVAIHRTTGALVRVVEGADFYSYPRWGASSSTVLSWRQWNHPDLPFEGVTLHWATWDAATNTLSQVTQVAGADRQCVAEAVWTPDGRSLVFGMEAAKADAFRQLYRVRPTGPAGSSGLADPSSPEAIALKGLEDCEFGDASWMLGW